MKNKDTGEFELVVGDKQLLSGFFLGVVLLAVVFALGYVLGRSSPKSSTAASDTTAAASNAAAESRPLPASPVPASTQPATSAPPEQKAADPTPQTAAANPPAEAPPQPTTVPAREPKAASAPPAKAAAPPPDPATATYWQVSAGSKSSAEAFSQALKDKGFPVITHGAPNNLTAVWVGPFYDKESFTKAKKQLEEAGFQTLKRP